ncbi:hypothetical protein BJV78DRAFT_1183135 [Lactifluus subvellereus]|nr:hypothetical protein BJV78DRAFT_1183135 [Lactifluus subvellereus]
MAPTLRSSTTPGRTGMETTPTKSPRKTPHCAKCQRPRAGHPRQGCPYAQSPRSDVQPTPLDITESMDSLAISPTKTKRDGHRRRPPAHEMTLASLSTESSNILNQLLQPEDARERDAFSFEDGKSPFREGRVMPGTLITPTQSFFFDTPPVIETVQSNGHNHSDSKASVVVPLLSPPPMGASALPLARSMSVEERMTFLDGLAELSRGPPAAVYPIHVHELHHVAESARKCGFHTGTVFPKTGSMEEGLLILGRDLRAVEDLLAKLSQETPKQSGIRAAAGGAVAGAVATFTGLALA